jgi:hypothetical protein
MGQTARRAPGKEGFPASGTMIAGVGGDVKKKHNSRYVFALQPTRYRVNGNKMDGVRDGLKPAKKHI